MGEPDDDLSSWRRGWPLILRAAKAKDRPKDNSKKKKSYAETRAFAETLGDIDAENDRDNEVNERD